MSVESNVQAGEKFAQELAAKKEAERLAALTPELKAAEEAKKTQEAKGAADKAILEADEATLDDAGKARKTAILAERQATVEAEEKRLLSAKEEELTDDDRKARSLLVEQKALQKEEDWKNSVQKRIDEVSSELKSEKNARVKDLEKIKALEAELAEVKGSKGPSGEELDDKEQKRIQTYMEKDKNLDRAKRREMSDEELDDWLMEDMPAAQRWLARQELRRKEEREADLKAHSEGDVQKRVDLVIQKQKEAKSRAIKAYPEASALLDKVADRSRELLGQGKSKKEIDALILSEIPEAALIIETFKEDQDTFAYSEDGPELLAKSIQEKLKKPTKRESQDERDERIRREAIEAERVRQSSLPEHLRSNHRKEETSEMSQLEKEQFAEFQRVFPKKTIADFKAMQKRRAERAGV